jgi:precorrin-8X/cobalt-precorrin-8 methylmutase
MGEPVVHPIEAASYRIMAGRVDLSGWPPGERDVVARMIHATADEGFAESARIGDDAINAALDAFAASAPVVCDSRMVMAGIPRVARVTAVHCYLSEAEPVAPMTRSAAAVEVAAANHPTGAIWVVGNAPTALASLLELYESGAVSPAAVIGLPVGYVGAAESKEALWGSGLRRVAVTNTGPRGGSPVAAAAMNALLRLYKLS